MVTLTVPSRTTDSESSVPRSVSATTLLSVGSSFQLTFNC